jgi:hypothetical protein
MSGFGCGEPYSCGGDFERSHLHSTIKIRPDSIPFRRSDEGGDGDAPRDNSVPPVQVGLPETCAPRSRRESVQGLIFSSGRRRGVREPSPGQAGSGFFRTGARVEPRGPPDSDRGSGDRPLPLIRTTSRLLTRIRNSTHQTPGGRPARHPAGALAPPRPSRRQPSGQSLLRIPAYAPYDLVGGCWADAMISIRSSRSGAPIGVRLPGGHTGSPGRY